MAKKPVKKKTKEDLIADLRKGKTELQQLRFRLSSESQRKTARRRDLRRRLARVTADLRALRSDPGSQPKDA